MQAGRRQAVQCRTCESSGQLKLGCGIMDCMLVTYTSFKCMWVDSQVHVHPHAPKVA
jgi:hypothetical protein